MDAVVGILLAAGSGSRFGRNKLLHRLEDGIPMGVAAARNLAAAVPRSIAVVRPADTVLHALLENEGLSVVTNRNAARGIGSSIACGVAATSEASGWVIGLGDMPHVRPSTIHLIVDRLKLGNCIVVPVCKGQRGHPVAFARRFFDELTALNRDRGARDIIARHQEIVARIETDDSGILLDLDFPLPTLGD